MIYSVVESRTGKAVGTCALQAWEPGHGNIEVGHVYVLGAVCFVYTCRRLIDLALCCLRCVYMPALIDLFLLAGTMERLCRTRQRAPR